MFTLANIGVPMLLVIGPALVLGLVPIAAAEAGVYRKLVPITFRRAILGSLGANVFSTLLGVPLTWAALAGLQLITGGGSSSGSDVLAVTWQAPWLMPDPEDWMVPIAAIVLNVPFFVASALSERLVLRRIWKDIDPRSLGRACWRANAYSYAGLTVFWVLLLLL